MIEIRVIARWKWQWWLHEYDICVSKISVEFYYFAYREHIRVYTGIVYSTVLLNVSWAMDYMDGTCQCNETSISGHGEKCSRTIHHVNIRVCISWRIYQAICWHKKRFHADELRLRNCKRFSVEIQEMAAFEYKDIFSYLSLNILICYTQYSIFLLNCIFIFFFNYYDLSYCCKLLICLFEIRRFLNL